MSEFLYPAKYLVYQQDNSGNHWVPALFTHRDCCPYLLSSDSLESMVSLVKDPVATGDSDPVADIRVVEIGTGEIYCLTIDQEEFVVMDREWDHLGADKAWFDFN